MKIVNLEQNTAEWLEWREGKATASQAPSVMGESKYFPRTPYEMYLVETGQADKPFYSKAMQDGHKYESKALELANKAFNANYQPVLAEMENPIFTASLDGYDENAKVKVLEIKTTTENSDLWKNGLDIYHWQLVHQCMVAGTDKAILAIYAKDTNTLKPEPFKVKKSDVKKLQKAWIKYIDCMDNMLIPELTDRDFQDGESIDGVSALLESIDLCKQQIDEAKSVMDEYKQELIELCGNKPTKAYGKTISKVTRKGNINYRAIPELKELDLEQYRGKSTEFWSIR